MTAATLRSRTAKDLAQLARQNGIPGWHSMRKEELVTALIGLARKNARSHRAMNSSVPGENGNPSVRKNHGEAPKNGANSKARRKLEQLRERLARAKNLASRNGTDTSSQPRQDRLVVMVRDPYWLHAFWELSQHSVDRAQAALGQHWHSSQPTLRVFSIKETGTEVLEKTIQIHGGVSNWYVDVQDPPCEFRMEIGYQTEVGSFYCLARSNSVKTPTASTSDAVDENWADVAENADRIFAMSGGYSTRGTSRELQELLEERLQRPLGTPMTTRYGNGVSGFNQEAEGMPFAVDAEVIVYGATDRHAHITLKGEPVCLRPDGTFAVRLSLPDARQVIPIVASSHDGVEQRTIVLAVERNTKTMESIVRDGNHK